MLWRAETIERAKVARHRGYLLRAKEASTMASSESINYRGGSGGELLVLRAKKSKRASTLFKEKEPQLQS